MSCYSTKIDSVFVQMFENRIGLIVWILQLSAQVVMNIHISNVLWATSSDFLLSMPVVCLFKGLLYPTFCTD